MQISGDEQTKHQHTLENKMARAPYTVINEAPEAGGPFVVRRADGRIAVGWKSVSSRIYKPGDAAAEAFAASCKDIPPDALEDAITDFLCAH
jgi:hypothetical protein